MKKIVSEYDVFCNTQIELIEKLKSMKLVKMVDFIDIADPISEIFICRRYELEVYSIFDRLLSKMIMNAIDEDGKDRIDRLSKRGLVSLHTVE